MHTRKGARRCTQSMQQLEGPTSLWFVPGRRSNQSTYRARMGRPAANQNFRPLAFHLVARHRGAPHTRHDDQPAQSVKGGLQRLQLRTHPSSGRWSLCTDPPALPSRRQTRQQQPPEGIRGHCCTGVGGWVGVGGGGVPTDDGGLQVAISKLCTPILLSSQGLHAGVALA